MKDPLVHGSVGAAIAFALGFATSPAFPFYAVLPVLLGWGIWREWNQSKSGTPPWRWTRERWLEALAWPAGGVFGALGGVWV